MLNKQAILNTGFFANKLHLSMDVCRRKDSLSFPRPLASTRVSLIKHNFNIICNTLETGIHKT